MSTTKQQEPVIEATPPKEKPRPGLGRFRSGSRGRSTRKPSPAPTASLAAVTPTDSTPAGQKEKVEETKPEVGTQSKSPPKGQARSRTRSARGKSPASNTAAKYGSEIDRMSKAYPSVGRRTAGRLFEEFGDELLTVIDNQPERIKAILPEHRAQAVIDGRKAERESNDAS